MNQDAELYNPKVPENLPNPDKVFACVGKGSNSAIMEYRYGLEAYVGLEMDLPAPIMDVWVLNPPMSFEDNTGPLFLLSLGNQSVLAQLSSNAESISAFADNETDFVLEHGTLAASMNGNSIIQVTEQSVLFINGENV